MAIISALTTDEFLISYCPSVSHYTSTVLNRTIYVIIDLGKGTKLT